MLKSSFPGKVLLLGEYTILSGSKALAIPYEKLSGHWSFEKKNTSDWEISRKSIQSFLAHSSEQYIDLPRLKADVSKGLWFDSNIPHGYGVGSSGALVAAIYAAYGITKGDLQTDKTSLGKLEDYFHGSSSGLDPLVSFLQKPLLIHNFKEVQVLERDLNLKGFFLLDSGKPRQTGPLVSIFQDKLKDPQFKQGCSEVLSRDVNLAIDSVLKNDVMTLKHHLWHVSKFQWDYFPEMIPTNIRGPWTRGLETGDYVLKLCGAGGGGYVLGYAMDPSLVQATFSDFEITLL